MGDDDTRDLAPLLVHALPPGIGRKVEITGLRRLSGGASRETWAFDAAASGDEQRRLVLQRVRPGAAFSGPSMEDEDRLLSAAVSAGVPVPPVVVDAAACAAAGLGEARVTGFVDGEALGSRIVRGDGFAPARRVLVGQCARALAAIHGIDSAALGGLEEIDPLVRLRDGLDLLDEQRPAFEVAMRWLAEHRPPPHPTVVVHGDFRVGNLLVDPDDGLRAVLDWELAHLGDPLEDLGWLCVRAWRFGGGGEVGGVGPLDELVAAYAEATGQPVDIAHVRWWMVAGTLTWGLICAVQARRHLDGLVRSVELAAIGRRVVETEYDLCQLLGVGVATPRPDIDDASPSRPIERPTATELVDAVRRHLADQVAPTIDGAAAFQIKVAANALAIVERELRLGSAAASDAAERCATLGVSDERSLSQALREGTITVHRAGVSEAIRASVVDRLRIANPRWEQAAEVGTTT